jgi:hypothetical protein
LFNVSGRDAIEVTFASGRKVWVGTDDPNGLAAILRIRMEELRRNAADADTESPMSAEEAAEPVDGEHAVTTSGDDTNAAVAPATVEPDAHPADSNAPTDSE